MALNVVHGLYSNVFLWVLSALHSAPSPHTFSALILAVAPGQKLDVIRELQPPMVPKWPACWFFPIRFLHMCCWSPRAACSFPKKNLSSGGPSSLCRSSFPSPEQYRIIIAVSPRGQSKKASCFHAGSRSAPHYPPAHILVLRSVRYLSAPTRFSPVVARHQTTVPCRYGAAGEEPWPGPFSSLCEVDSVLFSISSFFWPANYSRGLM